MLHKESDFIHCNNLLTKETPATGNKMKINPGNDTENIYRPSCFKCIIVAETTHYLLNRTGYLNRE